MMEKRTGNNLPSGYTNLTFDAEPVPGPSAPSVNEDVLTEEGIPEYMKPPSAPYPEPIAETRPLVYNPPSLVFEQIYEACVNYLRDHCCYSSRFINQMKLTDITNKGAFHYVLESYGETRESTNLHTPYKGGPVDGPENGPPPDPWDMVVRPPVLFKDIKIKMKIPHTEYVVRCSKCSGSGNVTCSSCSGSGHSSCWSCSGSGRNSDQETCTSCSGSGRTTCWSCSGSGTETCSKCDGYGKIKMGRLLIVTWKNHRDEFISDTFNMPPELIRKVSGVHLFSEEEEQLQSITNAPVSSVNTGSENLIQRHRRSFPNELIIKQRHTLRAVPLTKVLYKWKDEEGEFYVYGLEKKVYFEDYPQKCCCCACC